MRNRKQSERPKVRLEKYTYDKDEFTGSLKPYETTEGAEINPNPEKLNVLRIIIDRNNKCQK